MEEPTRVGKTIKQDHSSLGVSFKLNYPFWRKSTVTNKIQPEKQPFGILRLFRILNRLHKEALFHLSSHGLFVSTFVLLIPAPEPFVLSTSPLFAAVTKFPGPRCPRVLPLLHSQLAHVTGTGLVQNGTSLYMFGT